jgi:DNA-binding CsgD family transcriptional regulator
VVEGLWHGRKQAAVAAELGISIHTLDTHWRRIKQKLGVNSPVEVVHRVYGVVMAMR